MATATWSNIEGRIKASTEQYGKDTIKRIEALEQETKENKGAIAFANMRIQHLDDSDRSRHVC